MDYVYQVYGDRDETQGILICEKMTFGAAVYAASELAESWDRLTVYKKNEMDSESRVAVISLKGV